MDPDSVNMVVEIAAAFTPFEEYRYIMLRVAKLGDDDMYQLMKAVWLDFYPTDIFMQEM